jgi:adenylate cyclase, class 2
MPHEIEIKLRISDLRSFRNSLTKLQAKPAANRPRRVHEMNVLFDSTGQQLAKRSQLLRIRTEAPAPLGTTRLKKHNGHGLLTFKTPVAGQPGEFTSHSEPGTHKIRDEIQLRVDDPAALAKILEGLGLPAWFRYEKFRTTYRLPSSKRWAKGLLIELDETPIGPFVELEGPPVAIDRAAKELGFSKKDYIAASYLGLYFDHCRQTGRKPADMLFRNKK